MPRSRMRNMDEFKAKLHRIADDAEFEMYEANKENALTVQRHVMMRVSRVSPGEAGSGDTAAAFSDPSTVTRSTRHKRGWKYGLVSKYLKKLGWKAHWIEFGTKGYKAGDRRSYQSYGVVGPQKFSKKGKPIGRPRKGVVTRTRAIDRNVPARPARPFFRPGIEAARREIEERWYIALKRAARWK